MNDTSENRDARPRGGEYHIGDAVDVITDLEVSPALIALDDAWARPGRQGAFGVDYAHALLTLDLNSPDERRVDDAE